MFGTGYEPVPHFFNGLVGSGAVHMNFHAVRGRESKRYSPSVILADATIASKSRTYFSK